MNAATLNRRSDTPLRLGAVGLALVIISGMVAMSTSPDDSTATKITYALFMVGMDVIAGAACVRYSAWLVRAAAVLVFVTITLGPFVEFIVRSIIAIH